MPCSLAGRRRRETSDSPDWLASVHQQTQDCRSLSAAELVELAQEADCRVEISWSRQHSQQGGLDAIFHRYQPLTGERVMFRFPTDHAERPLHSLSSKPLRQQFLQKTQQRLVEMLEAQLPTYMVPQTLTVLDAMPVNPNGKVDRKALEQQADTQSNHSGQKQQPSTPAERAMQQLWAGVLAIAPDSIGLDDSFFRLGGDSIAAMKLVGEARRAGIQLTVADLFRNPRLDQLTAAATASTHASPVSIPQSSMSGRWRNRSRRAGCVRIRGPLDLPALHSALLAVERRHETLRTTFATVDGASVQVVQPFQAKDLNIIDIVPGDEQGLAEAVQQEQGTVFNLRTQPGWRVTVYRVGEHDHVLSIVMHHIISDGWSVDVLMRELAGFYSASVRGHDPLSQVQPLPVQYRDFSLWQRQQAQADEHQKQLSYWVEQLQTSRPAELLCDKPRPAALSGQAGVQSIEIAGPLYAKLQSFCQLHGVTQFVVLLAAFRTAHFRLTGQDDATIGTVNANRDRWEIKDMIGFFVSMQCLRITIGDDSFEQLVQQVNAVAVASHANADVPFESIVSKLKATSDSLWGSVMFSTDLYAPETIDNLLSVFQRVLEACLDDPQAPVASMPLLREDNYAKLDAMGLVRAEETAYPRDSSVVDLFREQAAACPSRVAVKDSVTEMTYAQLDTASDVLARWLARRSLAPETLVGVFASRSCEAIVAFLGILKANLAYLPFDVKIPRKRMEDILSSLPGHRIILVGVGAQPPSTELSNIELVGIREALDEQTKTKAGKHTLAVCSGPSATSLAYVMFTSGSTGMPKGVMAEHRGIQLGACHGRTAAVPLGVVGELVVTGDGLARGYTDPARNIDRFVSVEIGGKTVRAYRTGDYVRHRPTDGQLEFFGRMDGQVKIRGNRVELGEVEHALRSDKAVREAVAVLQQHDGSEARLAGFVTVHEDAEIADEQDVESRKSRHLYSIKQRLTELLEAQLPAYMVPQTITILDAMPVNQNGKADRKALEQQIGTQEGQSGLKRQPETEMQRTMQQLWAGVLAIAPDSIGLDDSFFRLGGDSIAAMKLVGEARRAGIQLTVADLFRNPRLDQLTAAATASTHASPVSIPQVEHVGPVAQSFAQGRLWFLEELHPGLTWYLMPLAVRIRGPLDLPALHSALLAVERRHETLRTTFATVDGASVQVVQPFQAKDLNIIDIVPGDEQGLTEAVQQEQGTVFNLRTQPGWRVTVYRVGEHDHVLSIVMHHIISDGWSVDVLMRELAGFYSASVRGHDPLSQVQPLPVQYRDFSLWQRQQAQADEHQKQLSYWVEQLQTSRPAELLCDKPRPAALSGQAGVQSIEIAGPLYAKLQSFCQLHGVTQFVVLLAAFRTAHFRLTGQDDATIGTVNANRDRWEIKDMIGFFVNCSVSASRPDTGPLKSWSSSSQRPVGSVMFSTDLYAPETIDNLLSVFQRVLEACLDDPQAPVASMPLLREDNYAKLDAMGLVRAEETAYPRDSSVVDLFREQAAACPSRVAVKDSVTEMTYAQLDTASDVLARWLARRSLAPETLVGVFASRSCEAIVAFLGILKANLAYLPFDVKIPRKRMEDILSSLPGHRIILVGVGAQPPSTELSNIELVGIREALDEQTKTKAGKHTLAVCSGPSATSLAYVMFTSGSTGMPKGVMAEHRGIVRLVRDNNLVQHLPDSPVMAHMANLAFDASTLEIYTCLLNAGTLVCIDTETVLDATAVLQTFRQSCIRSAFMAPSLFRMYVTEAPGLYSELHMLCVGGEALHTNDLIAARQHLTGVLVNAYGPTENGVVSTIAIQLGAFVMDAKLQLVPLGVVGELVVTGDGLARGYTDPARNIDRFVSVEIGGKTVRAYRTGDYVRHRPTDGQLEFFGRMDGQVKIRGNRVELGEVEHALRSDKAVREAVAVLQQHDGSEARLAGFVTVHEDAETADEHVDDSNESQHVDVWEDKFDADIYSPIDNVQKENIGRDFVGWTSMYDGSDIDKAEMNEWLDDTIDTMLNGQRPGNVLEIGSGTGMILFNLGDGLQSYVGLDPSRKAVQFIAETAKSIPGLAGKIRMYKATAADVGRLEQPVAASLVVINSVVQYFPSLDYLFKTVQQLVELEGTRTLFFGDVRSYALHREFLATRAVHMAGDRATKADIRRMVADMERVERELLVDPAFFTALPSRLPGLVDHVEILPKRMKATNELSCYRYAAVVHLTPRDGQARELAVREVADDRWIDFAERRLDRQSLLQQLHGLSTSPTIAVSNIPYSKTMVSRCLVRSLEGAEGETSDSPDWLASVHQQTQDCRSLSAAELVELAQEADCRVEISWSRQHSQQGGLDAIFHRYQPLTGERVMFRFPTDHAERPLHSLSSKPLRQQFLQKTQQRLVEMLEAQLPTYMVPQTLTVLDAMPVNPNGKVDRKALEQQADTQSNHSGQKQQPSTPAERAMQQLWAGVLAIAPDSIGLDDSFFRLGGDSIAAMKLVGEARRAGIQLTVADLFRNPRLDQLTAAATASTHASPVSIPQVEHVGPVAQSFAQGRLWFLEELHPGLTWYLMPLAVRIRGPLDLPALHSALLAVERRHETLRTTFATVDGASVQVVQPFQAKDLNIIDIVPGDEQGLAEAVQQEQGTVFNLRTQPGWRVTVYRVGEHDHVLSIVMHHIISDGWSVDVLMRELAGFYSASVRGHDPLSQVQPLPVQYRDFSLWQRQQAQADEHQKQLSYWVEQLQTSRPAELLCDKPRPAALSGQAGVQSIEIAGPLYAKLQSFCQLHGVTQFVVLLAAFRTAHFRLTGQDDATIGTVNANRDRWEIKDMIGFFVNMQCLRITAGHGSFEELVQQVHEVTIASHANADVPFESIVSKLKSDRDLSRHPLVQLVFAVHAQQDLGQLNLEGVQTESLADAKTSRFDLEFHFSAVRRPVGILFSTDLYAPETIDNLLSVFQRVLEACLDDPQAPVASMPLLREDNYAKLDAMGLVRAEETAYPRDSSVVDLFREQAAACPSRVAVKDSVTEMTYAQLDTASDVLARWLARRSLAPETLVGVFASRSCEAIVAFLGILKANLAYLPFDVKIPRKRMEDILSSLPGHRIILVGVGAQPPSTELSNIELVGIREALDEQTKTKAGKHTLAVCSGPSATSLAYVMFTSGSTGMPKGVMAEHRGIVRLVRDNNLVQHLPDSPVMAHMANLAFDASTWEIYSTLLRGGTLVCIGAAMVLDAEAVLQMFREHCIRTAYMAPSLFRSYILQAPALFTGLDMLCVGGEAVHPADLVAAKQYLTGKGAVRKRHSHRPRPQQLGAFVMDAKLQLVPLGVVGELVVTGDGLARGYTDPARNIDRFVSVEIGGKTVRAYRTGDYVRHRPTDGQLEFFGRMDGQVKIRGNRVELGEVEHALRSDKAVREAVAVLQQHDGSEARLAGFVTVHEDAETADEHVDDSNESQHVDVWEDKFDADIYSPIDNVQKENIGRDFVGWTSMYDGSDIDKAEMNEWLDDTIDTMLNGQRPGNVLEIGSGTGMILFNLGDGLQSYVGLDPSRKAVQFIAETAKSIPGLAGKIRMYKATAADVGRLEQPVAASLVVINSVVQYFPSLDYLFKTVQQLVELEGTRTLFFGDVRSYALHREFLATRAVHMAGDRATKADIRRMVADMERVERELLVDPAFFTALPSRLPGLVDHVEILPKRMKATNELSCYRYAAVVHLTPRDGQARELAVREVADDRWIDFAERRLDRQSLLQQLHGLSTSPTIAVSNIPYSKTMVSRCLVRSLEGAEGETSDSPDWLASVHQQTQDCRSLSAAELVELAQEADCRVEISWSRQHSQQGGLDAIFHRYQPLTGERVMFRFPTDHAERPLHSLSSKPLRQQFLQKTQQRLVEMLEAQLPTYMVPQTLTVLDAMPVNPNGKVDRKALEQQADTQSNHSGQKQQPSTPAERAMQQLWAGVLAIAPDSIGLDDSFFRLGGDSIAAMKLVGEARRAGIQLTVADLFRNPRLDQLTAAATASTHASPVSIPQVEHVGPVAQSFAQGRLWFLEELHPGLTWYLMPLAVRIRGPLDLPALHSALLAVERRHETLRTTFATVDGASVQVVQPFQAKDLNIIDIVPGDEQGLTEAVHQDHSTPFDLRTQPGWRVTVYRVGEHDHVLSIVMHHIISDGWSVDVLMRELAGFYSASVRGHDPLSQVQPLPVQYRDFSLWQRQQAQADEHQKQLSYWVEQLQTSRPAELLCDKPRPAALSGQAGLHGVTQFVVLLAAFRTAHFRLTGQDDATIGTVNANRDRWEIKDMIGFFVNMQCLRITAGHGSFEELSIVSKLKSDRDLSRHPLVQLVFAVHAQQDLGQLNLEGVQTESLADAKTSRFDLEFHFSAVRRPVGNILFSTDLYAPETIDNLLSVFQRVLEACLDDPQAPVASMPLLREDNYAKLDAMGLVRAEETAYPRDSSVVDLFREQAAACPSRVAVKDSVTEMTYAQLDTASDVLARWLARRSLAPETLVGVFASRSCEAIVAFLGILKANLAYLPFDVKIPRKRMESSFRSRIELSWLGLRQPLECQATGVELCVSGPYERVTNQPHSHVCSGPSATSLAYVMFTSGSTGMPKGVMVSIAASCVWCETTTFSTSGHASHGAHANLAFDARRGRYMHLGNTARRNSMTPSLFRSYILQAPALFTGLDMLCVGGEAVHPADLVAAKQYLTGKFVNGYGPTENTTFSATFLISPEGQYANGIPIGRALSNSGAFVMDAKLQLVPLGVVGELVVTGDGLARGYTDPARNIDRFVSVEIGGKTVRAYRTGDYVRHRPTDGQLEFFGRMDGQVKIRGNRVELGEVEHALRSDKAVREAVAVLQQHDGSEARLAGFVTVHEDAETADEHVDDSNESQHVDVWEDKFDADIYSPIDNVQKENIGRDFVGWTSMYDGSDIDKAEMNEWLDDTIDTMLNGQRPGNVLEIGSGTGMILFNLGDGLQSYVGLDPSRKAVQFIAETAKSIPGLAGKIRMYKATAADVGRLEQPVAASLVTVQQLVELEGTRTLFFGDVRSYALHREFLATRAVHMAGDRATKADIRRMVADMERVERELLVDPAFFTALPSRLPGLVDHVEILPKRMKATNELSCYRYAAVVHLTPRDGQARELAVREVADDRWIDFAERRLDRQSLLQQLHGLSTSPTIAVSNIPYSKTMVSRCLVRSLEAQKGRRLILQTGSHRCISRRRTAGPCPPPSSLSSRKKQTVPR
ncbi:Cyclosporine synthetase [Pyrenophora teres f. teres]|uniref:Cyclosporine synthetase n=1 Tax=Pyrenophora teres f. teres TaxID=97479 RepID=A0A6S6WIF2_9PLEO|nr:Cyclosporine synthetase [Pyrenophora teres f. teres]